MDKDMEKERNLSLLNELLTEVKKSEEIYENAANSVHDSDEMKSRFKKIAYERRLFGSQVMGEIFRLGGVPRIRMSIRNFFRRAYLAVNRWMIGRNNPYVLRVCLATDQEFSVRLIEIIKKEISESNDRSVTRLVGLYYSAIMNHARKMRDEVRAFPWGS